jgi:hypothetical protein
MNPAARLFLAGLPFFAITAGREVFDSLGRFAGTDGYAA